MTRSHCRKISTPFHSAQNDPSARRIYLRIPKPENGRSFRPSRFLLLLILFFLVLLFLVLIVFVLIIILIVVLVLIVH